MWHIALQFTWKLDPLQISVQDENVQISESGHFIALQITIFG